MSAARFSSTRLASVAVVALALLAGPTVVGASAHARTPDASDTAVSATYEAKVVRQTNHERTHRGRHALRSSSCVDEYAEAQARAMAAKHEMFHQPMGPIMRACHLRSVGENVAYGFTSGADVTDAWMHSPGHRKNILTKRYRQIGVGAVQDDRGVWYVSQVFGRKA